MFDYPCDDITNDFHNATPDPWRVRGHFVLENDTDFLLCKKA